MNRKEWRIPYRKPEQPAELLGAGYGPLLSAILALRGIRSVREAHALFEGGIEQLHDPFLMKDMATAVERIRLAVSRREKLAVYGDYDVDGITATCLLTDYLRSKGLSCVPYIPDRNEEGYGLNCAALDSLRADGVSLLITVDCGITAVEEADHAREIGLDMIVTDHHECKGEVLPDALAVIDCKQPGNRYPNPELAGVGVALKLVCACEGDSEEMLRRYADFVALGTVADVMPLIGENRYLVRRGLAQMEDHPRPGFTAMLKEASIDPKRLTATTIGYSLAPRLNAAGRLGQASIAGELLLCPDCEKAAQLAAKLCELNRQRQNIETEIWQDAQRKLAGLKPDGPIVLASESWHQGVIGIAASRLAEQYSLPAIMICLNGEHGKGSCRSYGGFNLFEALSACSQYLVGFGGHALAAGLNIQRSQLEAFRQALNDYYRNNRPEPQPEICCDLLIRDPSMLSIENVRELDRLEPFGSGNPKPVLCMTDVELEMATTVGGGRHLRLRVSMGQSHFDGIFFSHTAEALGLGQGDHIDLAFTPQINEYRGHVSVQLLVAAIRKHGPESLCERIFSGDRAALWAALDYYPERGDFVRLWRSFQRGLCLPGSYGEILSLCPKDMEPERFSLCLRVFSESGLLDSPDGSLRGARDAHVGAKVDLEETATMRELQRLRIEDRPHTN